ncbi:MAG: hypothetical protein AAF614_31735 [Chloroflexota bacterium]
MIRDLDEVDWGANKLANGIVERLSKIPFAVKLFRLVATNSDIDWVVTNNLDSTVTTELAQDANDVRWKVEQFHRKLKSLIGSEKCQYHKQRSQRNHLAIAYKVNQSLTMKAIQLNKRILYVTGLPRAGSTLMC